MWERRGMEIRITHLPTGFTAKSSSYRSSLHHVVRCTRFAIAMIKAQILRWATEPEINHKRRIRSWHMAPYLGLDPFAKDDVTGTVTSVTQSKNAMDEAMAAILDGKFNERHRN